MLPFAYYLLKVIICSAILFGYYWFFLRNKVFHAYNRFYLLAIVALSIFLPLLKLDILYAHPNKTPVIKMLQIVNASDEYMDEIIIGAPTKTTISLVDVLPFVYMLVSTILLIMLLQMLSSIFGLLKKHEKIAIENIQFINTDAARGTPFSFFRYIFWNKEIDINSHSGNRIFKHEIAHVQERHSWDKMFINLVLIIFWSNPIFGLVRRELGMIHEFIADKKAVEDGDTASFAEMILHATYPQKNFYITNNFFYSPIKRRLMMLTKNQHPRMNYISRLLVLPLLVIVFGAFTIKVANSIGKPNYTGKLNRKMIVVIDAGHGGQDAGAINKDGITEKDLALQLAKKIKALNEDQNIQIVLSRESDVFADPRQKAEFAKAQNPDMFISIHLESTSKNKWNTVSGMNVYVTRKPIPNLEKSKILASAMISSFNKNYELNVSPMPNQREKGIWILDANTFPSILLEPGYLTNDKDLAYLQSEKGQETFARNVLAAINNYSLQKESVNQILLKKLVQDTLYYFNGEKVKKDELELKMQGYGKIDVKWYKPNEASIRFKTTNNEIVVEISGRKDSIKSVHNEVLRSDTNRIVFTQVENEPEFAGGTDAWRKFLQTNLNGSLAVEERLKPGSYTFITRFIVHEDGTLSDFFSEKNSNEKIAKHCIEVLKKSPKWTPGKQNGHIVAAYRKQPITFVVSDETNDEKKIISQINPSLLKHQNKGAQSLEY